MYCWNYNIYNFYNDPKANNKEIKNKKQKF